MTKRAISTPPLVACGIDPRFVTFPQTPFIGPPQESVHGTNTGDLYLQGGRPGVVSEVRDGGERGSHRLTDFRTMIGRGGYLPNTSTEEGGLSLFYESNDNPRSSSFKRVWL